jgi:alpha-galactosidase
MGWLTVMQNTNAWTTEQHAAAKQEFALYKERLRPFIRDADLYHISVRPDGVHWDGIEYYDTKHAQGLVYAFRGSSPEEEAHTFLLSGLQSDRHYRLHFQDGSLSDRIEIGHDLMSKGLSMKLTIPNSSELVFIDEVR